MKKSVLLITAASAIGWLTLSSYKDGPGVHGLNRTGGPGSGGLTCSEAGCHGPASPSTKLNWVEMKNKSTGEVVGKYVPGQTYEVSFSCMLIPPPTTNYKIGFQIMALKASDNTSAGILAPNTTNPGNPINPGTAHVAPVGGRSILEHSTPIDILNNAMSITFDWTAPAAGTGDVTFYAIVNAVNGNDLADNDDMPSSPLSVTIPEQGLSVAELDANIRLNAYPNPSMSNMTLSFEDATPGQYDINVMDLNGRAIYNQSVQISSSSARQVIPASQWASGMYLLRVSKEGAQRTMTIVKQ